MDIKITPIANGVLVELPGRAKPEMADLMKGLVTNYVEQISPVLGFDIEPDLAQKLQDSQNLFVAPEIKPDQHVWFFKTMGEALSFLDYHYGPASEK